MLGNGIMWLYYLRLSRTAASPVMESQWRLFRAKTGTSSIVVLSLLPNLFSGVYGWLSLTDPLGSIVVAGFLLHSAFSLLTSSMKELVDSSIEEVLQLLVLRTLVKHADTYLGFRGIRSRRVVSKVFLEISLEFKAQITMEQFEGVASVLRKELQAVIPGVDVTIVPFAVGSSEGPRATS